MPPMASGWSSPRAGFFWVSRAPPPSGTSLSCRRPNSRQKKNWEQRMNLDLTGKTALVTGSMRGIGLATAIGLAQMGAEVIVNGREQAAVSEAAAKVRQAAPAAEVHSAAVDLGG